MTLQEIENKCCELEEKVRTLQAGQPIPGMIFRERKTALSESGEVTICDMGRIKGRNRVIAAGFSQCPNPNYFQRGFWVTHYNMKIKAWILYETKD